MRMSMFTAFNISASGMTAQQLRTDVISQNIANANTTRTSDGTPYVKKSVVFTEKTLTASQAGLGRSVYSSGYSSGTGTFADALRVASGGVVGDGVKVTSIYEDTTQDMNMVYDPSHPDADEEGYVDLPNINLVEEMVGMISASKAYEANATVAENVKTMMQTAMNI